MQVVPLDAHPLLLVLREILTAEPEGHWREEALRKQTQAIKHIRFISHYLLDVYNSILTHGKYFVSGFEMVPPGNTQHIGQVEAEVYEAATGSS